LIKYSIYWKSGLIIFLLGFLLFVNSCEDPVPTDYKEEKYVEAFLLVGEPVKNIIVMKTQPVTVAFNYDSSLVHDAFVKIIDDEKEMILEFRDGKDAGYYFPDTTYLIKPETDYKLEIICCDNTVLTGETTTPAAFNWINPPKKQIQYPKDTLDLPFVDSLVFEWEGSRDIFFYMISVRCIDTLEYGKYLDPATEESNRRIGKPFSNDLRYRELSTWTFMPNTKTPVVWNIFKWFGMHEVSIYAPDSNFLNWALQYFISSNYDSRHNSINGGIGVFGSASVVRDTSFIIKNQP